MFGAIRSPAGCHAPASHLVARVAMGGSTPPAMTLVDHAPDVMDQDASGSCEGHAHATAIAARLSTRGAPLPWVPSPDSLYRLARSLDRAQFPDGQYEPLTDGGCSALAVSSAISRWGIRPMSPLAGRYSDVDLAHLLDELTLDELEECDRTTLVTTYEVTGDRVSQARRLLAAGVPLVVECFVDSAYMAAGPGFIAEPCDPADKHGGDHAQCVLAYRTVDGQTQFLVRNSWGRGWATEGSTWATEAFINAAWGLRAIDVRRSS